MSRLSVANLESDTGPSGQIYGQIKKAIGSVPNTFAAIATHGPAALKSVLAADAVLAAGTLSAIRRSSSSSSAPPAAAIIASPPTIISPSSPEWSRRCSSRSATVSPRATPSATRWSASSASSQSSGTVSDEDFAAIKAAGYSDVQLVEISLAFATTVFTNVFNRINDTAIDFPAVA